MDTTRLKPLITRPTDIQDLAPWLLTTISTPIAHHSPRDWTEAYAAMWQVMGGLVTAIRLSSASPLGFVLDTAIMQAADRRLPAAVVERLNHALAAAQVALPGIKAAHDRAAGKQVERAQRVEPAVERQLLHEVDLGAALEQTLGYPVDRRLPGYSDSASAAKNFMTRIAKPSRSVLHLAVGLHLALDRMEKHIARLCGGPTGWERHGIGTLYYTSPAGDPLHRPMLSWEHALLYQPLASQALSEARLVEPLVRDVYAKGRSRETELQDLGWAVPAAPS